MIEIKSDRSLQTEIKILGVEGDRRTKKISFIASKEIDGVDVSEFEILVKWKGVRSNGNMSQISDKQLDGENILFSWEVPDEVYSYGGSIRIMVSFINDEAVLNTKTLTLSVERGLDVEKKIEELSVGILSDLIIRLSSLENSSGVSENVISKVVDSYFSGLGIDFTSLAAKEDIPSLEGYAKTSDYPDPDEIATLELVVELIEDSIGKVEGGVY